MSSPSHPFASPLVHPTPAPTSALIFLHGRGDSSRNFLPLFTTTPISTPPHTLGGILSPKTRIVVPTCLPTHSPIYGTRYAVWFDMFHERGAWNVIRTLRGEGRGNGDRVEWEGEGEGEGEREGDYTAHQKHSIRACVSYLHSVIETEIASGIPASQIWVGRISQGMGAAMLTFLCGRWKLGGVVGLSGWVPFAADLVVEALSFIAPDLIPQDTSEDEKKQLGLPEFFTGMRNGKYVFPPKPDTDDEIPAALMLPLADRRHLLRSYRRLIGIPALPGDEEDAAIDNVLATPVFLGHGTADRTLRYQIGRSVYTLFRVLGVKVEWRRYEGLGHWWRAPEEVDDMVEFMVRGGLKVEGGEEVRRVLLDPEERRRRWGAEEKREREEVVRRERERREVIGREARKEGKGCGFF